MPEINQIQFACTSAVLPAPYLPSVAPSASPYMISFPSAPAPVPIQLPAAVTSSQPPALSAHEVWNPEVKSSSFSSRENQSVRPPSSFQKIPDSVPADVKTLLRKFPSILRTGDVKLTPTHGVENHIRTGSHPPVFAKSRCLDQGKLQIAKSEFKRLESAGIIRCSKSPWASPLQMVPKKDLSWRWGLSQFKFGDNPRQVSLAKHAGPFQWPALLYSVFKNRSFQGLSSNPCRDRGRPKNCNHYAN